MNGPATAPLRVVHLLDTDNFAGTERYVLQQMTGLRAAGVEAILACRRGSALHGAAVAQGLEAWPVWQGDGKWDALRGYRALRSRLKATPIDLLQAHNGRTMLMAAMLSARRGIAAIGTQHFLEPRFTTYRGLKRAVALAAHRWVNDRLSHVICVSDAARGAMIQREGIPSSKVTTVHSGIDPLPLQPPQRNAELRKSLGLNDGDLLLACVARLEAEKSLGDLIAAMPAVLAQCPGAKLVIAGDGKLRVALEAQVQSLGLTNRVSLLGFRSDAADIIATADVFVLPSVAEPFGLVLLEAMALGKPVIACRAGGPAEIVVHGVTGILVSPAAPIELANAIAQLLGDPRLGERMSRDGLERFRTNFTTSRMIDGVLGVYHSVLSQRQIELTRPAAPGTSPQPTS